MINLEDKYFQILLSILKETNIKFYAFGSRAKGTNHQFSDLDLIYKESVDKNIIRRIKSLLRESNLPIIVDIIDYNSCSEAFKKVIDSELIELPSS